MCAALLANKGVIVQSAQEYMMAELFRVINTFFYCQFDVFLMTLSS